MKPTICYVTTARVSPIKENIILMKEVLILAILSYYLTSTLYKLTYSSTQIKSTRQEQKELKRVSAIKTFFINDINRSLYEINELKEIDKIYPEK